MSARQSARQLAVELEAVAKQAVVELRTISSFPDPSLQLFDLIDQAQAHKSGVVQEKYLRKALAIVRRLEPNGSDTVYFGAGAMFQALLLREAHLETQHCVRQA